MGFLQPPVLLQQYTNHDSILHKVYVLGEKIWVFPRPSLPNIPNSIHANHSYVEFDSQEQPYPDFANYFPSVCSKKTPTDITANEIMPVVTSLRQAFGLDLFGFDVLVSSETNELVVVDVNYFPSYKEVHNFPKHLARF